MPVWLFAFVGALSFFAGYQVYRGIRWGAVRGRSADADRRDSPIRFWVLLSIYGFSAIYLPLTMLMLVVWKGLRWS